MIKSLTYLILLFILCVCSCGRITQSDSNTSLAQYRDTIVGCFNGTDIDTLIAEPTDLKLNMDCGIGAYTAKMIPLIPSYLIIGLA